MSGSHGERTMTRATMLIRIAEYVETAFNGDAGELEEAVPGTLDELLADVREWVLASDLTEEREWYALAEGALAHEVGGAFVLKDWTDDEWEALLLAPMGPKGAVRYMLAGLDEATS